MVARIVIKSYPGGYVASGGSVGGTTPGPGTPVVVVPAGTSSRSTLVQTAAAERAGVTGNIDLTSKSVQQKVQAQLAQEAKENQLSQESRLVKRTLTEPNGFIYEVKGYLSQTGNFGSFVPLGKRVLVGIDRAKQAALQAWQDFNQPKQDDSLFLESQFQQPSQAARSDLTPAQVQAAIAYAAQMGREAREGKRTFVPTLDFAREGETPSVNVVPNRAVQSGVETVVITPNGMTTKAPGQPVKTDVPPGGQTFDVEQTAQSLQAAGFVRTGSGTFERPVYDYVPDEAKTFGVRLSEPLSATDRELAKKIALAKQKGMSIRQLGTEDPSLTMRVVAQDIVRPRVEKEIQFSMPRLNWGVVSGRNELIRWEPQSHLVKPGQVIQAGLIGVSLGYGIGTLGLIAPSAATAAQGTLVVSSIFAAPELIKRSYERPLETGLSMAAGILGYSVGYSAATTPSIVTSVTPTRATGKGTLISSEGEPVGTFTKSEASIRTTKSWLVGKDVETTTQSLQANQYFGTRYIVAAKGEEVSSNIFLDGISRTVTESSRLFRAPSSAESVFKIQGPLIPVSEYEFALVGTKRGGGEVSQLFTTFLRQGAKRVPGQESAGAVFIKSEDLPATALTPEEYLATVFGKTKALTSGPGTKLSFLRKMETPTADYGFWTGETAVISGGGTETVTKGGGITVDGVILPGQAEPVARPPIAELPEEVTMLTRPARFSDMVSSPKALEGTIRPGGAGRAERIDVIELNNLLGPRLGSGLRPSAPAAQSAAVSRISGVVRTVQMVQPAEEASFITYPAGLVVPMVPVPVQAQQPSLSLFGASGALRFSGPQITPSIQSSVTRAQRPAVSALVSVGVSRLAGVGSKTELLSMQLTGRGRLTSPTVTPALFSGVGQTTATSQLITQATGQLQGQLQGQIQEQITATPQQTATPPPMLTPAYLPGGAFFFGGLSLPRPDFGGTGSGSMIAGVGRGVRRKYAPSLGGIISGRTIRRAPTGALTGAEVRYPVGTAGIMPRRSSPSLAGITPTSRRAPSSGIVPQRRRKRQEFRIV